MSQASSFTLSMQAFADKTVVNMDTLTKDCALEVLRRVKFRTPVGLPDIWKINEGKSRGDPGFVGSSYVGGTLRANWQITVGAPATDYRRRDPANGTLPDTSDFLDKIAGFKAGDTIYIVNNAPYAVPVEYGHSTQAPAGMARVTVREWPEIVRLRALALKR